MMLENEYGTILKQHLDLNLTDSEFPHSITDSSFTCHFGKAAIVINSTVWIIYDTINKSVTDFASLLVAPRSWRDLTHGSSLP